MGIKIGNIDASYFKVGSGDCSIYLGDTKLYPTVPHDYSQDYFTIVSEDDNNTITLKNTGYTNSSTSSTSYWYSVRISASTDNGNTWSGFATSINSVRTLGTINKGQKMLFKGNISKFANTFSVYHYFDNTGRIKVEGNILSLFYSDNFLSYDILPSISTKEQNRTQQLASIFRNNSNLISAENLIIKPTTLPKNCCAYMFNGCTSLTTAPELPATTLGDRTYFNMFQGCTLLTTAPELPATTFDAYCYSSMFNGCTSLTTAPSTLPATTLTNGCYSSMFNGCTSLTTAPELPATTLQTSSYSFMFNGCTSLNSITCLATDISASLSTINWVDNVAANGTFTKNASMNSWTSGANGIPENWTVENYGSQDYQWVYYTAGDDIPSDDNICGIRVEVLGATVSFEITFMDSDENTFVFGYDVDSDTWYGSDDSYTDVVEITPSGGYATYIFSDNGLPDNCTIDSITSDFGDYIPCDLELYQLTT